MEISLTGGQILDSQVTGGSAFIDDLFVTRTLKIQASAAGPLADGLRVLREAPLSKGLGRLANVFSVSGGMRLDLDMVVPLHDGLELELDGLVSWPPGARIGLKGTPVELRDPQGQLRFDPHGVSADGIEAQLWGAPLRLDIGTQGDTPEEHLTLIRARATTPVATLAERLPSPLWSRTRRERPPGTLRFDCAPPTWSARRLPIDFELESDLKRVAVRLPAPLGKSAAGAPSPAPGRTVRPRRDPAAQPGLCGLKGRLAFAAKPGAALALTGGDIALGVELPTDPGPKTKPNGARREGEGTSEGIWFVGVIPELDGDAWRLWWDREAPALGGNQTPVAGRERPRDEAGLLRGGGLRIGSLSLGGSPWDDLYLRFQRVEYAWEVAIEGPEITGTLKVPDRPREVPVTVNLSHFDLEALAGDRDPASASRSRNRTWPVPARRAPAVRLDIEHLRWGKADLGRLALEARAQSAGLDITTLSLRGELATATGSGSWTQGPLGPDVRLKIKGDLVEPGALLRSAGYASVLDQAPAKVDLDLAWPGGPGDIALPLLIGQDQLRCGGWPLAGLGPRRRAHTWHPQHRGPWAKVDPGLQRPFCQGLWLRVHGRGCRSGAGRGADQPL